MEEMNMALSMLVKNFDIARIGTTEGKDIQERLRFRMAPDGLRIRLLRRANGA